MEEFILNLLHYSYSPTLKVFEANALIVYRCLNLQRDFKNTSFGVWTWHEFQICPFAYVLHFMSSSNLLWRAYILNILQKLDCVTMHVQFFCRLFLHTGYSHCNLHHIYSPADWIMTWYLKQRFFRRRVE